MIHKRIAEAVGRLPRGRRICAGVIALVGLAAVGWALFHPTKSVIFVDGKRVVCVSSAGEAENVLYQVKRDCGCNPEEVEFRQKVVVARAPRDAQPVSRHRALSIVRTAVSPVVCRWSVIVNGKPVVAVPSQRIAGEVLDMAKLKFGCLAKNLAEEPQFKENVKVDTAAVSPSIYRRTADAAVALMFEKPAPRFEPGVYVVRNGDIACVIASRNHLALSELKAMNPGVSLDHLSIGDRLRIKAAKETPPSLTVVVRDMDSRIESAPPPVRQVSSARLYTGKTALVSPGRWGKRKVRVADIYENGKRVGSEIMEEEILQTPSPRIVAVGIKPRPTWN